MGDRTSPRGSDDVTPPWPSACSSPSASGPRSTWNFHTSDSSGSTTRRFVSCKRALEPSPDRPSMQHAATTAAPKPPTRDKTWRHHPTNLSRAPARNPARSPPPDRPSVTVHRVSSLARHQQCCFGPDLARVPKAHKGAGNCTGPELRRHRRRSTLLWMDRLATSQA